MKKWICLNLMIVMLMICLSGCTPELHQRLLVKAVGIDLEENGYRVTVCASKTDGGGEMSSSAVGETVPQALESIALQTGKKPLYAHMAVLVFGMDCAEQGIDNCLDFFLRHYDSKPTVKLCVSKTTAEELLTIPEGYGPTARAQQILDSLQAVQFTGSTVDADLIKLVNQSKGKACGTVLPQLQAGEPPVLSDAVLLQDMQVSTVLDRSALRGYLLLSDQLQAGETPVQTENCGVISVTANTSRCDIRFSGTKEDPAFTILIHVKGEISALAEGMQHLERTVFPELERAYAEELMRDVERYIHSAVQNGADAVGFTEFVREASPDIWDSTENRMDLLQQAHFEVQIIAEIDRVEEEDTPYL